METQQDFNLSGLAKRLVHDGLLNEQTAQQAQQQALSDNIPLVNFLTDNDVLSAQDIAHTTARSLGIPLIDLDAFDTENIPTDMVNMQLVRKLHIIPLMQRGSRLYIGISDPTDHKAIDTIKFQTGLKIHIVLIEHNKLERALNSILNSQEESVFKDLNDTDLDEIDISSEETYVEQELDNSEIEDAPIVRFVHKILLDAIHKGASDIHFEPYERNYRVRFRIDGILYEIATPPTNLANRLAARLKVMSKLDISERRIPQDGRFKMNLSRNHSIDFRVSTCPTTFGEKIVMRLLDPAKANLNVTDLGFEDFQQAIFDSVIHKPQGMLLVTGPTGSGKTVTLYSALNILNTKDKNISTVEDPVEINMKGINQVHVNQKSGLTFSLALRAFLRQDPDIIMVGEIRDLETAEIGVKAAQTGHMVLSTLHTNSAPETLTRLMNMGIASFNIATSVELIIAQRLARKLCPSCREDENLTNEALLSMGFEESQLNNIKIYKPNPKGCEHCTSGYKGRVGIYELLLMTKEVGAIIMNGGNSLDILKQAEAQGFKSLRKMGLEKVMKGVTSLSEIERVTKD